MGELQGEVVCQSTVALAKPGEVVCPLTFALGPASGRVFVLCCADLGVAQSAADLSAAIFSFLCAVWSEQHRRGVNIVSSSEGPRMRQDQNCDESGCGFGGSLAALRARGVPRWPPGQRPELLGTQAELRGPVLSDGPDRAGVCRSRALETGGGTCPLELKSPRIGERDPSLVFHVGGIRAVRTPVRPGSSVSFTIGSTLPSQHQQLQPNAS